MKKNTLRILSILLIAILLMGTLTGCSVKDKSEIRKLLVSFETGCRDADLEEILDCFDPQVIKPIKSTLNLLGTDLSDISDLIYGIIGLGGLVQPDENDALQLLQSIRIKPSEYTFHKDQDLCEVTAEISYEAGGESYSDTAVINCVNRDGEWYLLMN